MNYSELQSQIASTIGRSDLTAEIVEVIATLETELSLGLRCAELQNTATLTKEVDGSFTLPDDFVEMMRVRVNGDDIEQMNPEVADTADFSPVAFYMLGSTLHIRTEPDDEDTVVIDYYKRVPALSDSSPTNLLLTRYPTVYITGCMLYLKLLIQDLEEAQAYGERFNSLLQAVNKLNARRRGKPRLSTSYVLGQGYTPAV